MRNTLACLLVVLGFVTNVGFRRVQATLPFQGTLKATETDVFAYPAILVDGTGSGVASLLGHYTTAFHITVDLSTASGPASATLEAANGDTITAEGTGQASDEGTRVVIVESYTITGGTGRFKGASGEFTVSRVLDPATSASTGSFSGTLAVK